MLKSELITPYYADQNQQLHEAQNWGESGKKYAKEVYLFAQELKPRTILDYGCGRGTLRGKLMSMGFLPPVREYDPAIPVKSDLPEPADLVVCTDVMEHVEPEKIDNVLQHIYDLSEKACFMVIATRDCNHVLPDGRSCHLTVESADWWLERVERLPWKILKHKIHINEILNIENKVAIWLTK